MRGIPTRHVLSVLCFLGLTNVYLLRVNLNVAIVAMVNKNKIVNDNGSQHGRTGDSVDQQSEQLHKGDFHWDEYKQGIVLGSFFYGYILGNIVGGRLSEHFGGKKVFGLGLLFTALLTMLTEVAARTSVNFLIVLRVLEGLFEGVAFPSLHTLSSKWMPTKTRGVTFSTIHAGAELGTVIGYTLGGVLSNSTFLGGWPAAFYVFGVSGIIWFVFWWILVAESPTEHRRISPKERDYILDNIENKATQQATFPWWKVFTSVPVWTSGVSWLFSTWAFYLGLTELPTFMHNMLHYDLTTNGFLSSLPHLANMAVQSFGGFNADFLVKRKILGATNSRKAVHLFYSLLSTLGFVGVCLSEDNRTPVIIFITIALGCQGSLIPSIGVAILDMTPDYAGTLMGLVNAFGNISGFLSPLVAGALTRNNDTLSQWHLLFYIASGLSLLGALLNVCFGTSELQPWGKSDEGDNNVTSRCTNGSQTSSEERTI